MTVTRYLCTRTVARQPSRIAIAGMKPLPQVNQRRFESVDPTQPPQDIPSGPRWRLMTSIAVGVAGTLYFMRMNREVKAEKNSVGEGHGANQEYKTSAEGNKRS